MSQLQTWRSLPDTNEVSRDFPSSVITSVEATLDRLAVSHMFFIARRKNANQDVFYFSAKLPQGTPFLIELTTVVGNPGVKCAIKTPNPDMAPCFFESLETLFTAWFCLYFYFFFIFGYHFIFWLQFVKSVLGYWSFGLSFGFSSFCVILCTYLTLLNCLLLYSLETLKPRLYVSAVLQTIIAWLHTVSSFFF